MFFDILSRVMNGKTQAIVAAAETGLLLVEE